MEASTVAAWAAVAVAIGAAGIALAQAAAARRQTALLQEQLDHARSQQLVIEAPRFALRWEPRAELPESWRDSVISDRWPQSIFVVSQESGPPTSKVVLRISDRSCGDFLHVLKGDPIPQVSTDHVLWSLRANESEKLVVRLWKPSGAMVVAVECEADGKTHAGMISAPFDLGAL